MKHIARFSWGKAFVSACVSISMALVVFGTALPITGKVMAAALDSPTPTVVPPAYYELYKPPITTQGITNGLSWPSLFGPQSCADYGDASVPSSADYNKIGGKYTYRIAIPSNYASSQVNVQLFDPDTGNKTTTTSTTITRLNGTTASATCTPANLQYGACALNTSDAGNPWWIVRSDENRQGDGTTCTTSGNYLQSSNTRTLFRLYYYDGNGNQVDLAYYVGKDDDPSQPVLASSPYTAAQARSEGLATDLMWVSPGAPSGSRMPAYTQNQVVNGLPMLIASAAEPATQVEDCNTARRLSVTNSAGTFPVSGASACQGNGDFIIDLASEIPGLAADGDGARDIYLDVRSLSGASENSYDVWAGPVPTGLPAEVNARNLAIGSQINAGHANPASTGGVQIVTQNYQSINTETPVGTQINLPLTYLPASTGGLSMSVRGWDIDTTSALPIIFYLDSVPKATWAACFAASSTDCLIAGLSNSSFVGSMSLPASMVWSTFTFTIPSNIAGVPFGGGNLFVTYPAGYSDTVIWNIAGGPPLPPVLSAPADSGVTIGTLEYSWLASGSSWASRYTFQYDDNADFSSPIYTSGNISGLTFTPPDQAPGTYYWRVRAGDSQGRWGFWSMPRTVIVQPATPLAPALVSPADHTLTDDTTPDFNWALAMRADTHTIQIDNDADFSSPLQTYSTSSAGELSYTATPLAEGLYYWRVRGTNAIGNGPWSAVRDLRIYTSAPAVPGNFHAVSLTKNTITLAWDDTITETGFRVERSDDGLAGWVQAGSVGMNTLTLTDSGLACATPYYYHVQAFNTAGDSAFSDPVAVTTGVCPPAAPSNLSATSASQTQINLSWTDNATDENGFRIERSPVGMGTWSLLTTAAANATSASDSGLTCGASFDYRVIAINLNGSSAPSATASGTSGACTAGGPTDLTATGVSVSRIDLAWADNASDEDGFIIERSPAGKNTWITIATPETDTTTYSDEGLNCGVSFDYRVTAFNGSGSSTRSNVATGTPALCLPNTPTNLLFSTVADTSISFYWLDNSQNESGYRIERASSSYGPWTVIGNNGPNQVTFTDPGLPCYTMFVYRITAYNAAGDSGSIVASIVTLHCAVAPPTSLTATQASQTQINLTWADNSTDETGFKIEISAAGSNTWNLLTATSANVTSWSSNGLTCGTANSFRVYAYNSQVNSAYSNVATANTAQCSPPAASGLTATTFSQTQVNLAWTDNSSNEAGFQIDLRPYGTTTWIPAVILGPNTTSTAITGLSCGTIYNFRVTSLNSDGVGTPSSTVNGTTQVCPPSAPTSLRAVTLYQTQIALAWTDNAINETGFKLERSLAGANTWTQITTFSSNATSYNSTSLACGTSYDYRLYAYNSSGNSAYATLTATTLPCTPFTPTGLSATPEGTDHIRLSWTDNSTNETGFKIERSPAGANTWAAVGTTDANNTTYVDNTVVCGTGYDYRVAATASTIESLRSNTANTTAPACLPGGPSSLTVTPASQTQLDLAWVDNASDEDGFRIERAPVGGAIWSVIATTGPDVTTYSETGLGCSTGFSYRVSAFNAGGFTAPAGPVNGTTIVCSAAAPSQPHANSASQTQINLSWTDNSTYESGFKIERSPAGQNDWTLITTTAANIISYSNTGLTCGTSYDYRISATNASGDSAPSAVVTGATIACLPVAPTNLSGTAVSQTRVNLSWTDNSDNETRFRIERSIAGSNSWSQAGLVSANVTTFANTNAVCGNSYDYRVIANNPAGDSTGNPVFTVSMPVCLPDTPSGFQSSAISQTGIHLVWVDNALTEDGYHVQRSPTGANRWATIATLGPNTNSYDDTGLTCASSFDYRVSAFNAGGDTAFAGPSTHATYDCTPTAPSDLAAGAATQNMVTVTWADNSDNEDNFSFEKSLAGANSWSWLLTNVDPNTTSVTLGLSCNTSYDIRLYAKAYGVSSEPSNIVTVTTLPCTPSAPSSMVAAVVSANQVNLTWSDNSNNETGFKVERSLSGKNQWTPAATVPANTTSYSNMGLLCNTAYVFRVAATNTGNTSSYAQSSTVTTRACMPAAPSGLGASTMSQTQIDLVWTDNSGNETGFKIERSPAGQNDWALIATAAANAHGYSDTGRTCATAYDYRVTSTNASGDSAHSNIAGATTADCAPGTPSNLTANATSQTQIGLSWTDTASNENGFTVERSPVGANTWSVIATLLPNTTTYSDSMLTCYTGFDYRVRAFNAVGDTAYSNIASATTDTCLVGAPTDLSAATTSQTQINLTWADNATNETGFKVERSPAGADTWAIIATIGAGATGYVNTDLPCGTAYDYRVFAFDSGSVTAPSNVASATTVLCTPDNLSATTVSQTEIGLSWDDNSDNEAGFKVEWSPAGADNWTVLTTTEANVTSYAHTDLTCATGYDYRVSATNAGGSSPVSNVATATTVICTPGTPHTLTATTASQTQINLVWSDNSDNEDGFRIEQSLAGADDWTQVTITGPNVTSFSQGGLACATGYEFRVSATNTGGESEAASDSAATRLCTPLAPSGLSATATSQTRIGLSWSDNSNNEAGFKVERSIGGAGIWTLITTTAADATSFSDSGLSCSAEYDYRVAATNSGADSAYSDVVSRRTDECISGAPTDLTATPISQTQIDLSWADHSNNEDGYRVERSAHGLDQWAVIEETAADATSFSDKDVVCGTGYDYRVTAFDTGGVTASSNVASADTLTCSPTAPDSLNATAAGRTQINLTWVDHSNDETGFKVYRAPAGTSTWSLIHTAEANATSYADKSVVCGTAYNYRVIASNAGGSSEASNTATATSGACLTKTPATPKITLPAKTLTTNDTTPDIRWSAAANADTYQVQIARDSKFKQIVQRATQTTTTYTPDPLTKGVYFVRVSGVNSLGTSGKWSAARKITIDTTPPPVPGIRTVKIVKTGYSLIALKSTEATRYTFQISADPSFASGVFGGTVKKISYTVLKSLLTSHTTYYWRVAAIDAVGNVSAWSAVWSFSTN